MNDAMTPASPALRLIEFWQLPQTIPPRLADRAKLCLLDALGCGLFGAGQPWGEIMSSEIFYRRADMRGILRGASCATS